MHLDLLVKVPTVKGKITRRKKSNVVYIEYEYDRVYDPSRKYTFLKRVTIGKLSDTDPELMKPNQNFLKYFPDAELPDREIPILVEAGDYIRFVPIDEDEYKRIRELVERGEYQCTVHEEA